MSGWSTIWNEASGDAGGEADAHGRGAWRYGGWAAGFILLAGLFWLFLFELGVLTTLGSVSGSERHGPSLVRVADQSAFGLGTMYAARGQRLWWNYDVTVEGAGGVRLRIAKAVPSQAFIVRAQDVSTTGRGRFEMIAPESGFYTFSQYLIPQGDMLGNGAAGATRYDLSWGIG